MKWQRLCEAGESAIAEILAGTRKAFGWRNGELCEIPGPYFAISREPAAPTVIVADAELIPGGVNMYAGGRTWPDREPEPPWLDVAGNAIWNEGERVWTDIRVESVDNAADYRSGMPGRPTSRHRIEQEATRRITAGEAYQSVAEESRHLSAWLTREHPDAPPATPKTIEAYVRRIRREARK